MSGNPDYLNSKFHIRSSPIYTLFDDFEYQFTPDKHLVVMPISRLLLHEKFSIGPYVFYPAQTLDRLDLQGYLRYGPQQTLDILYHNTTVAFMVDHAEVEQDVFVSPDFASYRRCLIRLMQKPERAMSLIRHYFCRLDLPDTLPGKVGTYDDVLHTETQDTDIRFIGVSEAMVCSYDTDATIVHGSVIQNHIVQGIGLELDPMQVADLSLHSLPLNGQSEMENIATTGLSLFTKALEGDTPTNKFIRMMILLEYLAKPSQEGFLQGNDVAKKIGVHIAKDKESYEGFLKEFQQMYGKKENGKTVGFRTRIVHQGALLEDLLDQEEITRLLRKLQRYELSVLGDMIDNAHFTWEEFNQYRDTLRRQKRLG